MFFFCIIVQRSHLLYSIISNNGTFIMPFSYGWKFIIRITFLKLITSCSYLSSRINTDFLRHSVAYSHSSKFVIPVDPFSRVSLVLKFHDHNEQHNFYKLYYCFHRVTKKVNQYQQSPLAIYSYQQLTYVQSSATTRSDS